MYPLTSTAVMREPWIQAFGGTSLCMTDIDGHLRQFVADRLGWICEGPLPIGEPGHLAFVNHFMLVRLHRTSGSHETDKAGGKLLRLA